MFSKTFLVFFLEFTEEEKGLLRDTYYGTIEPLFEENAANLFIHFIHEHPQYRAMFPWGRNNKSELALRVDPGFTVSKNHHCNYIRKTTNFRKTLKIIKLRNIFGAPGI